MMSEYDAVITSRIYQDKKLLAYSQTPVDITNKYINMLQTAHEISSAPDPWNGDENLLLYKSTSEESAMEQLDEYIGTHISLSTQNRPELVKVSSHKRDRSGKLIGTKHTKTALNTRIYNAQFTDGHFG